MTISLQTLHGDSTPLRRRQSMPHPLAGAPLSSSGATTVHHRHMPGMQLVPANYKTRLCTQWTAKG